MKSRLESLRRLQHSIHQSLVRESQDLLGPTPKEVKEYERTYERDLARLSRRYRAAKLSKLLKRAHEADVILVGDYHTYGQSQRATLRFLRELLKKDQGELVIGLELATSDHQRHLDQYLLRKINEDVLRTRIDYDRTWGFSWENYAPIFRFAREHRIPLVALNRPKGYLPPLAAFKKARRSGDLGARDEWAAGWIVDLWSGSSEILDTEREKTKVVVLYGELHLAPSHISARIREISKKFTGKVPNILTLHQNHDGLFWKLADRGIEQKTHLVELSDNHFCIFSGTPWTKLQSLINWIHGDLAKFIDEGEDDFKEEFIHWMREYGTRLAKFYKVPEADFATVSLDVFERADVAARWVRQDRWMGELLHSQERIYKKESDGSATVFASSLSENSAAELAAIHLLHGKNHRKRPFSGTPTDMCESILDHAFGYFSSLLINPRRKCDQLRDHLDRIRRLKKRGETPHFRHELESRKLFVQTLLSKDPIELFESAKPAALYTASRFIGHYYGHLLHDGWIRGKIRLEAIRTIFFEQLSWPSAARLAELHQLLPRYLPKRASKSDYL